LSCHSQLDPEIFHFRPLSIAESSWQVYLIAFWVERTFFSFFFFAEEPAAEIPFTLGWLKKGNFELCTCGWANFVHIVLGRKRSQDESDLLSFSPAAVHQLHKGRNVSLSRT